jgi:Flp pilus assembly pilin Flp
VTDTGAMIRNLLRDERGSNSVELAFVIPALILLTFGIVDFGRAVFDWNAVEKATQIGARETVIRDPIALPIKDYFGCNVPTSADVGLLCVDPAGGIRSQCNFGTVVCTSTGCRRNGAAIASTKVDQATFNAIVAEMRRSLPGLEPENVTLTYRSSKLGFIGKPNGPVPEVTAEVSGVPFDFLGLDLFGSLRPVYGGNWSAPTLSTTLTAEDLNNNTCAEQGLVEDTSQGRLICQTGGGGNGNASNPICF